MFGPLKYLLLLLLCTEIPVSLPTEGFCFLKEKNFSKMCQLIIFKSKAKSFQ